MEFLCAEPTMPAREPERRVKVSQHHLEKLRASVGSESVELERFTQALQDMGFSESHIRDLLSIGPGVQLQKLLDVISELILLGVNPDPVCEALKSNSQLLKLPIARMRKRCSQLRRLGLGEGTRKSNFQGSQSPGR